MERPRRLTEEMKLKAARAIAAELVKIGKLDADELAEAANQIADHGELCGDGYQLARDLDNYCYWDCDMEIAEALDKFSELARRELEAAEKEWFASHPIQPPFPIGTRVKLKSGETGVADGIYEYGPAKYLVKIDNDPDADAKKSRRIVNFEDAQAA